MAAAKTSKVALIDPNRSRNVEIMLSSIKVPYPEVAAALLSYNKEGSLGTEQLEKMRPFIPEEEELAKIKALPAMDLPLTLTLTPMGSEAACGGERKLGKAEKYFLAMSRVERFAECINISIFRLEFDEHVEANSPSC